MAAAQRDYYEVLGVARDADTRVIKDAFRRLALKYHPDRNKAPDAEERFKEIAAAYAVLADPERRAQYDARGFESVAGKSVEEIFGGVDLGDLFSDFGIDFGEGFFDRFFRGYRTVPARGRNIEVEVSVPLETVLRGGRETIHYSHPMRCPLCGGSGARPGTSPRSCPDCGGTGRKTVGRSEQRGLRIQQVVTCPTCGGSGVTIEHPCPECEGRGEVWRDETVEVVIPPGIEEGTVLRVPGHGLPGAGREGRPGDLFVVVYSAPDPRFQRSGADLWRTETIEVLDAVLGGVVLVPTLDGEAEVRIPPGTQPETVLSLRGKGLPLSRGRRYGDLNIRLRLHVPERLTPEQRELWRRLRSGAQGGAE